MAGKRDRFMRRSRLGETILVSALELAPAEFSDFSRGSLRGDANRNESNISNLQKREFNQWLQWFCGFLALCDCNI
jgi:hypothetical protein